MDCLRAEQMIFAVITPFPFTSGFKTAINLVACRRKHRFMALAYLFGYYIDANTLDTSRCPCKICVNELGIETDSLKNLGAAVALNR